MVKIDRAAVIIPPADMLKITDKTPQCCAIIFVLKSPNMCDISAQWDINYNAYLLSICTVKLGV